MDTARKPRIVIEDLPVIQPLTEEETAVILGAGRFQPMLEQLERREVMSANAVSNLGGVAASFNLNNGILSETQGPQVGVVASDVQGLFQGHDSAGHQVAYEWLDRALGEFTPDQGWVSLGNADQVVQDNNGSVLFTEGTSLFLANGVPGSATPLLSGGQQGTISLGGFTLSNASITLGPGGATLSGTTTLPLVGAVQLTGTISDDGSQFSLSAPVSSATVAGFRLSNAAVTVSDAGISLSGQTNLAGIGQVSFAGNIATDGTYSLIASPTSLCLVTMTQDGTTATNFNATGTVTQQMTWNTSGQETKLVTWSSTGTVETDYSGGTAYQQMTWNTSGQENKLVTWSSSGTVETDYSGGTAYQQMTWNTSGQETKLVTWSSSGTVETDYSGGSAYQQQTWNAAGSFVKLVTWNSTGTVETDYSGGTAYQQMTWNASGQETKLVTWSGSGTVETDYSGGKAVQQLTWNTSGQETKLVTWSSSGTVETDYSGGSAYQQQTWNAAGSFVKLVTWNSAGTIETDYSGGTAYQQMTWNTSGQENKLVTWSSSATVETDFSNGKAYQVQTWTAAGHYSCQTLGSSGATQSGLPTGSQTQSSTSSGSQATAALSRAVNSSENSVAQSSQVTAAFARAVSFSENTLGLSPQSGGMYVRNDATTGPNAGMICYIQGGQRQWICGEVNTYLQQTLGSAYQPVELSGIEFNNSVVSLPSGPDYFPDGMYVRNDATTGPNAGMICIIQRGQRQWICGEVSTYLQQTLGGAYQPVNFSGTDFNNFVAPLPTGQDYFPNGMYVRNDATTGANAGMICYIQGGQRQWICGEVNTYLQQTLGNNYQPVNFSGTDFNNLVASLPSGSDYFPDMYVRNDATTGPNAGMICYIQGGQRQLICGEVNTYLQQTLGSAYEPVDFSGNDFNNFVAPLPSGLPYLATGSASFADGRLTIIAPTGDSNIQAQVTGGNFSISGLQILTSGSISSAIPFSSISNIAVYGQSGNNDVSLNITSSGQGNALALTSETATGTATDTGSVNVSMQADGSAAPFSFQYVRASLSASGGSVKGEYGFTVDANGQTTQKASLQITNGLQQINFSETLGDNGQNLTVSVQPGFKIDLGDASASGSWDPNTNAYQLKLEALDGEFAGQSLALTYSPDTDNLSICPGLIGGAAADGGKVLANVQVCFGTTTQALGDLVAAQFPGGPGTGTEQGVNTATGTDMGTESETDPVVNTTGSSGSTAGATSTQSDTTVQSSDSTGATSDPSSASDQVQDGSQLTGNQPLGKSSGS